MLKFLNRTSAMIVISLLILLISPTISKSNTSAEPPISKPAVAVKLKPENIMVVSIVAQKDNRAEKLANFFAAKNSPFTPYAADFVSIADEYNLDYTLLPAITGVESNYGLQVPAFSYNPYGWNNGLYRFSSWNDATNQVAQGIRTRYINTGLVSPYSIGPRYAQCPNWASRVARNQAEITTY